MRELPPACPQCKGTNTFPNSFYIKLTVYTCLDCHRSFEVKA